MQGSPRGLTPAERAFVGLLPIVLIASCWRDVVRVPDRAALMGDAANMRQIYKWIEIDYRSRARRYPLEGGHKFVLAPWVEGTIPEKSNRNFDRFFNPALRATDRRYIELRGRDPETIWTSYQEVSSRDTT